MAELTTEYLSHLYIREVTPPDQIAALHMHQMCAKIVSWIVTLPIVTN